MFQAIATDAANKADFYATLQKQLASLLAGERDFIANAANFSAFIFVMLPDLNWAGFYLMRGNDLVLGPFQGKPACVRIAVWPEPRGVCGAAAHENKTQLVANVHDFPGHIACDAASNAEIVVPLSHQGKVFGVFDIDSPSIARFDEADRLGIEALVGVFLTMTTLPDV
jgi:L-methionine (R)-S-oxide reductase